MYTITNDGRLLYDPRFDTSRLENHFMSLEDKKIGSLTFTIYPNNAEYSQIVKIKGDLRVKLDGDLLARFRPVYSGETMRGGVDWRCEELIARLNDIKYRPGTFTGTPAQFLTAMIADFNARNLEADVVFYAGTVSTDDNSSFTYENSDYVGYWDYLVEMLPERIGGYLKPRYVGDAIYIDFLREEDLPLSTQKIVFGKNLADKLLEKDAETAISVLIPLGANVDDGQGGRTPLTIASVNSGKDYIENAAAITARGRREITVHWDGIESASELLSAGQAYLAENANHTVDTISFDAYDLHNAGVNVSAFRWLQRVPVVSENGGTETIYPITRMEVPLGAPDATTIQAGRTKGELTTVTSKAKKTLESVTGAGGSISQLNDGIKTETSRAKSSEQNITDKTGINSLVGTDTLYTKISQNAEQIVLEATRAQGVEGNLSGLIEVNAGRIALVVDQNGIKAASIVLAINNSGSSVEINADKIVLSGQTLTTAISGMNANFTNLITGNTTATTLRANAMMCDTINTKGLWVYTGSTYMEGEWQSKSVMTGITLGTAGDFVYETSSGTQHTRHGSLVTGTSSTTIYYLGRT